MSVGECWCVSFSGVWVTVGGYGKMSQCDLCAGRLVRGGRD